MTQTKLLSPSHANTVSNVTFVTPSTESNGISGNGIAVKCIEFINDGEALVALHADGRLSIADIRGSHPTVHLKAMPNISRELLVDNEVILPKRNTPVKLLVCANDSRIWGILRSNSDVELLKVRFTRPFATKGDMGGSLEKVTRLGVMKLLNSQTSHMIVSDRIHILKTSDSSISIYVISPLHMGSKRTNLNEYLMRGTFQFDSSSTKGDKLDGSSITSSSVAMRSMTTSGGHTHPSNISRYEEVHCSPVIDVGHVLSSSFCSYYCLIATASLLTVIDLRIVGKNMNNFFEEEKTIDDGTNTNDLVPNVSNSDVEAIQGMKSIDLGSQGVYAAWTDCLFAMDVPPLITKDYDGYGETEAKKAVAFAVGARYPIILKILME